MFLGMIFVLTIQWALMAQPFPSIEENTLPSCDKFTTEVQDKIFTLIIYNKTCMKKETITQTESARHDAAARDGYPYA